MSKILIAEDEMLLRVIAAEALEDAGYRVLQAGDGATALELLKSNPDIQVLVSDVKMPRMDGYTLAAAGLTIKPELQILMMTGYAQDPPAELMRTRMIQILRKPFDLDDLCNKVGELLA